MILHTVGIIFVIIGALIGFGARFMYRTMKKKEPSDKQLVIIKIIGFIITLLGTLLELFL